MSNKILVARPNAFIVKNMKQLLHDCGKQPVIPKDFNELNELKDVSFSGIVISIAVSSSLNASFEDALKTVLLNFKGVPILLATLQNSERAKKSLELSQKRIGSNHELVSVSEAIEGRMDVLNKFLILEKQNITNLNYNEVIQVVKNFFN